MALAVAEPLALGTLPPTMPAFVIRPGTEGEPEQAMRLEEVPTPEPGPDEVVVRVMAAGVNYNGVWAALGQPVSVFTIHKEAFHIAGSDASGVVWRVGANVHRWHPGDEVVVHCNQSCGECPECNGLDPMACSEQRIWGYETSWGSFAQFCRVQSQQLLPKPRHLTWEEAASYGLVYFTAYRMLVDRAQIRAGQNVLVWGGGGGLGSMAVQICRLYSANAIAVVSSDEKAALTRALGATAAINRSEFDLVKRPGESADQQRHRITEMRRFGKRIRELTGGRDVDIVFEHVGSATFPTSVFVCSRFGKVVICGATAGYNLEFDVRYLWMRQKSIIGSHFANAYECQQANELIVQRKIQPVVGDVFPFEEVPRAHQVMRHNQHAGKMVILVGAGRRGVGAHGG
ncbi:MAG TPA: crotonyl-CoA carboxylase/reductase [Candidatus Micrarchaeia archaeon]|nr:crotonyl-CoA carboxylase/reductase [Candidatus Micrarchaeia archaeon]